MSALTVVIAVATLAPAARASATATPQSWGANDGGQLCNTTYANSAPPNDYSAASGVGLPAGLSVKAVAAGNVHSLFLMTDGTVYGCGDNSAGQLGLPGNGNQATATAPVGLSGVIAIAAGTLHSIALRDDGTVWAWGDDSSGQLGNAVTGPGGFTPVQVVTAPGVPLTGVIAIAAGAFHGLALKSDGSVWSWGDNSYGELCAGNGAGAISNVAIQTLATGFRIKAISANVSEDSMFLTYTGRVYSCGRNDAGQLGINNLLNQAAPQPVKSGLQGGPHLTQVKAISAGQLHSLALLDNGTVMSWGDTTVDELSCGAAPNHKVPRFVLVACPNGARLSGVIAVAAGGYNVAGDFQGTESAALLSNGQVMTWGDNTYGNLGDCALTTAISPVPMTVDVAPCSNTPLTGVTAISVGGGHDLALT